MWKRIVKNIACGLIYRSGLFGLVQKTSARRVKRAVILCYHRVVEGQPDFCSIPGTQVERENFERQVRIFSRHYTVVTLTELLKRMERGVLDRDYLVLTFDDGFKDAWTHVFPVLKQLRVPATFFISPAMLGRRDLFWQNEAWYHFHVRRAHHAVRWRDRVLSLGTEAERLRARSQVNAELAALEEGPRQEALASLREVLGTTGVSPGDGELMMNLKEVLLMRASGLAEFGSHGMTHPILPLCSPERIRWELRESKAMLEQLLTERTNCFAYPFGRYSEEVVTAVRFQGYESAVTTRDGLTARGDDPFRLNRVNVVRHDTPYTVLCAKLLPRYWREGIHPLRGLPHGR
jgi:peptidoglycan/xylan/chitin deacetylase (PgdA/CDA1 family)